MERIPMLDFDADGTPVNTLYRDVYKSRHGAFAEAREVFVEGCNLPERWRGRDHFTVLELGFGLGVNFLATLAAWRAAPGRPRRLFFVSIEKHPLVADDLGRALDAVGAPRTDRAALLQRWPCAVPGLHGLTFDGGAVQLLLGIGDVEHLLSRLAVAADAFFLDGFAPSLNPAMWSPTVCRELARRARPGATLATYTASTAVAQSLQDTGFAIERIPGFGAKRHRLRGTYAPRWRTYPVPDAPPRWTDRRIAIIGGGLASAACVKEFDSRGWQVHHLRGPTDPFAGSAQPWGVEHLHLSPDDNPLARLTRAALMMRRQCDAERADLVANSLPAPGKLLLATDPADAARQRAMVERLGFPPGFVRALAADEASDLAGIPLAGDALWLPMCVAGPIAGATLPGSMSEPRVERIERDASGWRAFDAAGRCLVRTEVMILANGGDAPRLAGAGSIRLRRTVGQSTMLSSRALPGLARALGGPAYAVPTADGTLIGSSYADHDDPRPSEAADAGNCARLAAALGASAGALAAHVAGHHTGFRYTPADRLPLIGPMPDDAGVARSVDALRRNRRLPIPLRPGLYGSFGLGSRGLLWAQLGARVLAAFIEGEPQPIESDLLRSIAPGRFALRSPSRASSARGGRG